MKNYNKGLVLLALVAALGFTACGGGGGGSDTPAAPVAPSTFNVGTHFTKGPVDGAACELFEINSAGAKATAIGSGTTASGNVSFAAVSYSGNALIECTGGTYTDEATGNTLTAPLMRAVVSVSGAADFTVSPLTEIAVQLAASNLNNVDNAAVASDFGLAGVNITGVTPDDLNAVIAGDDNAGKYGSVLAMVSQVHATAGGGLDTLLSGLAGDLGDGSFSNENLAAIGTATQALAASPVAGNINNPVLNALVSDAGLITGPLPTVTAQSVSVAAGGSFTVSVANGQVQSAECENGVFNAAFTVVTADVGVTEDENVSCTLVVQTQGSGPTVSLGVSVLVVAVDQFVTKHPLPPHEEGVKCRNLVSVTPEQKHFQLADDFAGLIRPCFIEIELTDTISQKLVKVLSFRTVEIVGSDGFGSVHRVFLLSSGQAFFNGQKLKVDEIKSGATQRAEFTVSENSDGCTVTTAVFGDSVTINKVISGGGAGNITSVNTSCRDSITQRFSYQSGQL